jgi:hypothetical protein
MGFLERLMGIQTTPDLAECESKIQRHMDSYREAGEALRIIRDGRLYRRVAETFEGYLQLRWKMTPTHADRLIAAAGVANTVSPTGGIPQNERVARPLASLPKEEQLEAWAEAQTAAEPGRPTSKHVSAAVAKRKKPSAKSRPKAIRFKVPGAVVIVEPGRGFTNVEDALFEALTKAGARVERIAVDKAA